MSDEIVHAVVPHTEEGAQEETSRAEMLLQDILSTLQSQGEQIGKLTEHMLKLKIQDALEDVANYPEETSGELASDVGSAGEVATGAVAVPKDVVQDVLTDTDKGLKEIKPKEKKKMLFR